MYETFEHTADIGLRVIAPDLDTLFREAALGLFSLLAEPASEGEKGTLRTLTIAGERHDWLLFDWLTELLYVFDSERLLLDRFEVHVGAAGLEGRARAVPLDPARHVLLHEVKAITYHQFRVERQGEGWIAEFIVDV